MTGEKLEENGFKFEREYEHDQFKTQVFKKHFMRVELTHEDEELVSTELMFNESNFDDVKVWHLKKLDSISYQTS